MIICFIMYAVLLILFVRKRLPRKICFLLFLCTTVSLGVFLVESGEKDYLEITRNSYGDGSKTEEYQVEIQGEKTMETIRLEVEAQEYSEEEIQKMFEEILEQMDEVVLGDNESFERVDRDLNLVNSLETYPVYIDWELDSYKVMNLDGTIREEKVVDAGTLVELRGTISYLDQCVIYVRTAKIFPKALEGRELLIEKIKKAVEEKETSTRKDAAFSLPEEVEGKQLNWSTKASGRGYYVLVFGVMLAVFFMYRERDVKKRAEERRRAQLLREYPGMVTKMNMLLSTGMTVKASWEKIVQQYEAQKDSMGIQLVYEEMENAYREMRGGIPEGEAYERFGKRCELPVYMKFGAMLSQNLRKGSRGISDMLRVEAIQAFEDRKSLAKKIGEEAGTKLMIPMIGMLAVVMIMVMVPALMAMQF